MEKTIVTSGKTVDAAIEAALTTLGMERENVSVQILQQPKSGFLGFGAQPAKVQVSYEVPDEPKPEPVKSALGSASRSKTTHSGVVAKEEKPKPEQPKQQPKPEQPKPEQQPKPERPNRNEMKSFHLAKPEKKERRPRPEPVKAEPKVYAPAEPGSVEEKIEQFIRGLLEHMDSPAVPHCVKTEENAYHVELVGEDLGFLIGRRGDTLDAIQHLANYSVNRSVEGHIRINVDAEEYRAKREDSLRKYARKKAMQVLKARRRTTLEPMNAYERHIIHAALQDMENITTYSTGTEPNRRVVIEYIR